MFLTSLFQCTSRPRTTSHRSSASCRKGVRSTSRRLMQSRSSRHAAATAGSSSSRPLNPAVIVGEAPETPEPELDANAQVLEGAQDGVLDDLSAMHEDEAQQVDGPTDAPGSSRSSEFSGGSPREAVPESSSLAEEPCAQDRSLNPETSSRAEREGAGDSAATVDVSDRGSVSSSSSSGVDADEAGEGFSMPVDDFSGDHQKENPDNCTFHWRIKNYTGLKLKKLFSDEFMVGGYQWRLSTCPKPNVRDVSIYLHLWTGGLEKKFPSSWSRLVQISFRAVNQYNPAYNFQRNGFHRFRPYDPENFWGFKEFIAIDDLARGFLGSEDDLLIEADVHVCKLGRHKTFPEHDSNFLSPACRGPQPKSFSSYFSGWRGSGASANPSTAKKPKPSRHLVVPDSDEYVSTQADQCLPMSGLQQHFICPITAEVMEDPVVAADGYTYERIGIEGWLMKHQTSPMTNLKLPHKIVVPNHTLRSAILEWKAVQAYREKQKV